MSPELIVSRAQLYAASAYATYENNVMARESDSGVVNGRRVVEADDSSCEECIDAATSEYIPLNEIEEIGTLQCSVNCRCIIEYEDNAGAEGMDFFV